MHSTHAARTAAEQRGILPRSSLPTMRNEKPTVMEPSKKRPRLSGEAYGTILNKRADDETSLEVDYMILDYLAWKAIKSCFEIPCLGGTADPSQAVSMAEDFLRLFRERHPSLKFDLEMRLRMLLLKVITLLTHRFLRCQCGPSLETLRVMRGNNEVRAARWMESADRRPTFEHDVALFECCLPVPQGHLGQNRIRVLEKSDNISGDDSQEPPFYGTDESVSLLDIVPLFLQVCAVCRALHGGNMTDHLMILTKELMISACLEQFLVFGANGTNVIDQAFAWGFRPGEQPMPDHDDPTDDVRQLNRLFEDEDSGTELQGWTETRATTVSLLFPYGACQIGHEDQRTALVRHLQTLNDRYPIEKVNQQVRDFIRQLSLSIDEPVLAQLERGRLKDMSEAETQQFLRKCGPDVIKIFQHV